MIPYIQISPIDLGFIKIHFFGIMASMAVLSGVGYCYWVAERELRDGRSMLDLAPWLLFPGFLIAHLASVVFYFPERILENPLSLLDITSGLSSFGGMLGGVAGGIYFLWREKMPIMTWIDVIARGFSLSFIFGRFGCTTAHDHPGLPSDFFLAVNYPAKHGFPAGPRHDLGFYEFLFWIVAFLVMHSLTTAAKGKRRPDGFYFGLLMVMYTPIRFYLDFLRTADSTHFGLTFGQYAALGMFLWGGFSLYRAISTNVVSPYTPFEERVAAAKRDERRDRKQAAKARS